MQSAPRVDHLGLKLADRRWRLALPLVVLALVASLSLTGLMTRASAVGALISQGKAATASSFEDPTYYPASYAVDGNSTTRWSSAAADPQWLQVDLGSVQSIDQVVLNWEGAYGKAFQIQTSSDATNWTSIYSTTTGTGGVQTLAVSGSGRYVRMYGTVRGTGYGYSLYEFQVYGGPVVTPTPTPTPTATPTPTTTATTCGTANAAQGRTATASSVLGGNTAALAVDGNTGSRWESAQGVDPQWLSVDLGSAQSICKVVLNWETAAAKNFTVDTATSATGPWTTIYTTTTGTGGVQTLNVSGNGRYVRMNGTARTTQYGYSLWEFQVYAGAGSNPTTTPTSTPTTTPTVTPSPTPTGPVPGNWSNVWVEDFNGAANTSPTTANWQLLTGTSYPGGAAHWGTNGVETDTNSTSNVALDGNGHLVIKAIRDAAGAWTSGRIETQRTDFTPAAGELTKFSATLQQPDVTPANGLGYWPGFRATGAAYRGNYTNWPGIGEADIMSDVNGRSQLSQTLHCGTAPGGVCNEYDGRSSGLASCAGCQSGLHEYSMVIDRTKTDEEVRYYLDGQQTWQVRESQVGVTAWNAAIHHGFYLHLDLAMGGSLPNAIAGNVTTPTAATVSGGTLVVDQVTVQHIVGSAPAAMTDPATPAGPSVVKVTGTQGNWQLQVNGAPYLLKGITYGPPQGAADGYVRDIKNMGVNTIRTWGDDANSAALLDTAAQNGVKVIMGQWLNQGADYVNDQAYKDNTKTAILATVNKYKGYQGLLMWDVGNEVILTMQDNKALSAADVEARRVAYAKFVNDLAIAIHAADPNHPVTSTDAYTGAWKYYQAYSPALDLMAVNSYGAITGVYNDWVAGNYTKPFILTEGGPHGEWEVPNDVNGVATEPSDPTKRDEYAASAREILAHPGVWFGGTEFHYGLENDFGGVWLNTYTGGLHRLGYYALQGVYRGSTDANTPPVISSMTVTPQTSVPAGGTFTVNVGATDPNGDLIRYNLMYSAHHINGGTGFERQLHADRQRPVHGDGAADTRGVEGLRLRVRRPRQRGHRAEVVPGRAAARRGHQHRTQPPGDLVDQPGRRRERAVHGGDGVRRQRVDPLGQHLGRPAVDPGRPGIDEDVHPRAAGVGGELREVVRDPDLERRHDVDECFLDDHR